MAVTRRPRRKSTRRPAAKKSTAKRPSARKAPKRRTAKRATSRRPNPPSSHLSGYPEFSVDAQRRPIEYVGSLGVLKDPSGRVLGHAKIVSKWATPRSFTASHRFQIEVTTADGATYTGQGFGHGMAWSGRLKASRRRTR